MDPKLAALRPVNFDYAQHLDSVWQDAPYHVEDLHKDVIDDLADDFIRQTSDTGARSPLGWIIAGPAGTGKTHMLGSLRRKVWDAGGWFILFDLLGVNDFWSTAALSYLKSLQRPIDDGRLQYEAMLEQLLGHVTHGHISHGVLGTLANARSEELAQLAQVIIAALHKQYRAETQAHQDVIRALFLLHSNDVSLSAAAYNWLQGLEIEEDFARNFSFRVRQRYSRDIVQGLSWLMSLTGPALLAVDQIDAIVSEYNLSSGPFGAAQSLQEYKALSIIEGLGRGLLELRDLTRRTMTVVSCLEATWQILSSRSIKPVEGRFHPHPEILKPIKRTAIAEALVRKRLGAAYDKTGFTPPYPSWPFRSEAFETAPGLFPRQLLKLCDAHRRKCLRNGAVSELTSFDGGEAGPPAPEPIEKPSAGISQRFEALKKRVSTAALRGAEAENREYRDLLQSAMRCYALQHGASDNVDLAVDEDFTGKLPCLHVVLRFIHRDEGDRERHYSFRALTHGNPIAYQSRLRAAITASGIDKDLSFRRLCIIRPYPHPGGKVTTQLIQEFKTAGGIFAAPSEDDLRALLALQFLEREKPQGFEDWLRSRRPLDEIGFIQKAGLAAAAASYPEARPAESSAKSAGMSVLALPGEEGQGEKAFRDGKPAAKKANGRKGGNGGAIPAEPIITPAAPLAAASMDNGGSSSRGRIPVGRRLNGGEPGETMHADLLTLTKHTVIVAGSGSGKTVLLRRIIEEAALLGIPAIVLDTNNDLARLGDPWPGVPDAWSSEDIGKAGAYHNHAEIMVWTPGLSNGNPIFLSPMPDFEAVRGNPDELSKAIEMAGATLAPFIGASGTRGHLKQGVLMDALRYFAARQTGGLEAFTRLLAGLPEGVSEIGNAEKLAEDISNHLLAAIAKNPLFASRGARLDPQKLFTAGAAGKTRISVINFSGLPSNEARQAFVNQLQMALFTWIRKNPSPEGKPLNALYVIDEAQNFAPSQKTTPCKESMISLVAQARKYGLGMIFATQVPKGIDNKIVGNCSTHFYGRMNAPATIQATLELMAAKGGRADDIGKLGAGLFYFASEGLTQPVKVLTPLCLSHHPASPLSEQEVVDRT